MLSEISQEGSVWERWLKGPCDTQVADEGLIGSTTGLEPVSEGGILVEIGVEETGRVGGER